jgi:general secretion pathway protein G
MPKMIAFDEQARRALEQGMNKLADAVRVTLAPTPAQVLPLFNAIHDTSVPATPRTATLQHDWPSGQITDAAMIEPVATKPRRRSFARTATQDPVAELRSNLHALHSMKRSPLHRAGFTLLEIMLVVSIIVIILGVAISKLGNTTGIAKGMRVQADVQAIKTQLQLYESMNGFFPTTEQGLQALVTQPQNDPRPTRWYQLFKEMPKDPWGSDYIYRDPGLKNPGGYDLYSAGPDRQADTSDDDWGQN